MMLEKLGFDLRWRRWIKDFLSSGHSSVLFNGTPRKSFHFKRGVRQGHPILSLLFVLAADLLQSIVNNEHSEGRLQLLINRSGAYPIVQYADDTILIMPACPVQLANLKNVSS